MTDINTLEDSDTLVIPNVDGTVPVTKDPADSDVIYVQIVDGEQVSPEEGTLTV